MTETTALWLGALVVAAGIADLVLTSGDTMLYLARALFELVERMRVWD